MNHYVYILTDSNRACLHIGLTDDLENAITVCKNMPDLFFGECSKASRLVYYETLHTEEEAVNRFRMVSAYTRMQKEKLIRKYNPNWVNISFTGPLTVYKPFHALYSNRPMARETH